MDELFGHQTEPSSFLDISVDVTSFSESQNISFRLEDYNCDERSDIFVESTFRSDMQTLNFDEGNFSILFDETRRFTSMSLPQEKFGIFYSSYRALGLESVRDEKDCDHCVVFVIYADDSDKAMIVTEFDVGFEALVELTAEIVSVVHQRFVDDQFHTESMMRKLEEAVSQGQ